MLALTSHRPNAVHSAKARVETLSPLTTALMMSLKESVVGLCLAVVAAASIGVLYGERQEIQGRILFESIPPQVANASLLPAEDVKSLSLLLKSPGVLQNAIRELDLPIAPAELDRRLETKTPTGTPTITVALRWPGDGKGEAVLNAVMNNFVARVAELRARTVKDRLVALQAALATCDHDHQKAREELLAFCQSRGVADLSHEIRLTNFELDALSTSLSSLRRGQTSSKAQLALIERIIDRISREEAAPDDKVAAAPIAKQLHSPERIQFILQEVRHHNLNETQLGTKRKQYEHWLSLARQNGASLPEIERIQNELSALEAQAKDHEKVAKLLATLADPDQLLKGNLLQSLVSKKLEIELEVRGQEKNLETIPQDEKVKRDRMDALLQLQTAAAPLVNQVQRRETERTRLQGYADHLKLLSEVGPGAASVLQPAAVVVTGSARRWLLIAAGFVCAFLGWQGLAYLRQARFSPRAGEEAARRLGLPIMGRIPDRRSTGTPAPAELRAFTHLLRQRVPEAGATILFVPVRGGPELNHLLRDVGVCFASRDEKVLILDAVIPNATSEAADKKPAGLSDFLAFNDFEFENLIQKTEVDGVEFVSAGAAVVPPDALATHRMRQLMDRVRTQYSLVLVKGHSVMSMTDVQILAGYQEAVVLVLDTPAALGRETIDAIRSHQDAGVPLLGCVRVANE